ncbi:MAG: 8-oxo-dGTP diphosphatase [Kiritimatiellia bacterium]|nr:8-oxo-dGTP diphosphatase [Kiritimatiellia bacterium]
MTLDDVIQDDWRPEQLATLLFVVRDGEILLIHKKRGLGAGKINGPGGRLEPGETPEQAAVREVQEELCVDSVGVNMMGELRFQFLDGLSLFVTVFKASGCIGDPQETGEAVPMWTDVETIPYDKMWSDDPYWLPLVLQDKLFRGYFLFDDDTMLDHRVDVVHEL